MKSEFYQEVVFALSEKGLVSESLVESLEDSSLSERSFAEESVEIMKIKLEMEREAARRQHELDMVDREAQAKLDMVDREGQAKLFLAEARMKEAEAKYREAQAKALGEGQSDGSQNSSDQGSVRCFDASKHLRLVPGSPQFQDKDLDSYFVNFEHTATTLGWPSDKWPILLSTVLQGKAQTAYAALSVADKCSYEKIKMAILQAYEQVPEAYRQSFRNLEKGDDQTYVEFAKEKQQCFEKWCRSRGVNGFDSLQNLILLEDFKDNIPHSVRVHLDDLDVVDMQTSTAARKADDYAVTPKLSIPNRKEVES